MSRQQVPGCTPPSGSREVFPRLLRENRPDVEPDVPKSETAVIGLTGPMRANCGKSG
jgi:hypothetical protein